MGHYIQLNKASVFIKIHWTLNATTKECKKKQDGHTFNETEIHWTLNATPGSVRQKQKQDGTLHSMKQGKCFHQDTLDFECYKQGV